MKPATHARSAVISDVSRETILPKRARERCPWSDAEIVALKAMKAEREPNAVIAVRLDRSHASVRQMIHQLGIGRPVRRREVR